MIINTTKTIVRNVRAATIATEVNSREVSFIDAYGEPQVNVGGTIPYIDSHSAPQTFNLPDQYAYMRSSFPVEQSFDMNADPEAANKLTGWINEIIARLTAAKTALMAHQFPVTPDVSIIEV